MKKLEFFIFLMFVFLNQIKSQSPADTIDPLFGNYSLGTSSELIFQYTPKSENQNRVIFDFDSTGLNEKFRDKSYSVPSGGYRAMDVVTGDFNGDNTDEIITAWQSAYNWSTDYYPISLSFPELIKDSLKWTRQHDSIIDTDCGNQIRLISGNFDYDNPKEFILAYESFSSIIKIILYEIDSDYTLKELDRIEFSDYSTWDICAEDFDGDGLDELVIVVPHTFEPIQNDTCTIKSGVITYDYFPDDGSFKLKSTNTVSTKNKVSKTTIDILKFLSNFSSDTYYKINNVAVATGNFDYDDGKEIVYSYELSISKFVYTVKLNRLSYFDVFENEYLNPIETASSEYVTSDYIMADDYEGLHGYTVDVQADDVNMDGKDEVFAFSNGELRGMTLNPTEWFLWDEVYSKYMFQNSHNLLAVGDIDADTADDSSLTPEVVLLSFINDTATITIYKLEVDTSSGKISEPYDSKARINTGLTSNNLYTCSIALGDIDGDGIRLGKPTRLVKNSVFIPTLIVNAPPSHYDIINGNPCDVNIFYSSWSPSNPKPTTATLYKKISEQTITCSTELKKDWKVSGEFKTKHGFGPIKLKTKLTSDYGKKFSNKNDNIKSYSISESATADRDDYLFGMCVNYYLFEYPILYKGKIYGHILVSTPVLSKQVGKYSKNLSKYFNTYSLKHEPNNLLSYPYYNQINENSDLVDATIGSGSIYGTTRELSNVLNPSGWTLNMSELKSENISESYEFNIGMEASISGWGCSLMVKGEYGKEGLTSHTTTMKEGFEVSAIFDRIDTKIGQVEYSLQPYVYWSKNGAMIIDYNVELTGNWWKDTYDKPDLAFILPYRYSPEKGENLGPNESMRMLTSDIRYFPYDAKPGDSITILTVVRNFSMMEDPVSETTINFYLGDPADNGELIKSLTVKNIVPRNYSVVQFKWKTPSTFPDKPWIFAVIDPDDEIDEIHSNNNKGWIPLFGAEEYPPFIPSGIKETSYTDKLDLSNFPNPASIETTIWFNLQETSNAILTIYNNLGQLVEQQPISITSPGLQTVQLDVSGYAPGVYIYQVSSGGYNATKKLIVK